MKNWNVFWGAVIIFVGMRVSEHVDVEYRDYVFCCYIVFVVCSAFCWFSWKRFSQSRIVACAVCCATGFCFVLFVGIPMIVTADSGDRDRAVPGPWI